MVPSGRKVGTATVPRSVGMPGHWPIPNTVLITAGGGKACTGFPSLSSFT